MRAKIAAAACVVMLGLALAAPAQAQGSLWNQKTFFTFDQPVELPGGTVLPPGKYEFRLADPDASRYMVQVRSEDGSKVWGQFFASRAELKDPANKAELAFMETPEGRPSAVKYWWYPGQKLGREFIYPRAQATTLAKATHQPVLTTATAVSDDEMDTAATEYITEQSAQIAKGIEGSAPPPVHPAPDMTTRTEETAVATTGATSAPVTRMARRETLPRTASNMPLVALLGLLSLAGALAVGRFSASRA